MRTFIFFLGLSVAAFAGCGGAADTILLDGGGDGASGDDAQSSDVTPSDGGSNCDISRCAAIPAGFKPVRLGDAKGACPQSWTQTDVVRDPNAGAGACTCACNITTPPDCNTGDITRYGDLTTGATCGTAATTLPATTTCSPTNGIQLYFYHYATTGPTAHGGACAYDATVDTSKITSTATRVCAPPASCQGALCGGTVCVQQDGDVVCPTDFPQKSLVGASASADCGSCGTTCAANGTCTGTLSFFSDMACTTGEVDFTADGTCTSNTALNQSAPYYKYNGALSGPAKCDGTPPTSTATPKLTSLATVCCKP